jgi:hypothetical protein
MSITEVRFRAIRIPRIHPDGVSKYVSELYELFGLRVHRIAKKSDDSPVSMVVPWHWDGDDLVKEFDRISATGAKHDAVGLAVDRLTPMEFVQVPFAWEAATGIEAVYDALGVDYRILCSHDAKYVVLVDYVDYVTKLIAAAKPRGDRIGRDEPSPVQPRAVSISETEGDSLPVPATVKFADVYERQPWHMMALAVMFGAKYVEVKFDSVNDGGNKTVWVLDGLGRTAAERTKQYFEGPLAAESALRETKPAPTKTTDAKIAAYLAETKLSDEMDRIKTAELKVAEAKTAVLKAQIALANTEFAKAELLKAQVEAVEAEPVQVKSSVADDTPCPKEATLPPHACACGKSHPKITPGKRSATNRVTSAAFERLLTGD